MVDRGIVPKKQGKPMYEVKENSPTPNLQALEGNTYYFKCPNDNRYYKTIYIKRNPFSPNHLQPMISNEIYGEPPSSMQPISPLYVHSLLRMSSSPFNKMEDTTSNTRELYREFLLAHIKRNYILELKLLKQRAILHNNWRELMKLTGDYRGLVK